MKWWKKALGAVGDVAKFAAPVASFIPGVGPLVAGGIGLAGGALGQLNNKDPSLGAGLKEGLISGATAYGLGKMGGGGTSFLGNAGNAIKGVGNAVLNPYGQQGGIPGMGMGTGASLLGLGLGAANTFMNAQDATRYRGIEDEQINYAKSQQARQQAMQDKILGNINPALNVPNLGGIFEDTSNPFYKPRTPTIPGVGGTPSLPPSGPSLPPDSGIPPMLQPPDPEPLPRTTGTNPNLKLRLQGLKDRGGIRGIPARMTY